MTKYPATPPISTSRKPKAKRYPRKRKKPIVQPDIALPSAVEFSGSAGDGREVAVDRAQHGCGELGAMCRGKQQCLVRGVVDVAELDQDRGNVGRLEHGEPGKAMRIEQERIDLAQLMEQELGEVSREVLALPLGEIDQDRRHALILVRQIDAGDEIGFVFLGRERVSFRIGPGL